MKTENIIIITAIGVTAYVLLRGGNVVLEYVSNAKKPDQEGYEVFDVVAKPIGVNLGAIGVVLRDPANAWANLKLIASNYRRYN